jgi:hypothetical protein
MAISLHLPAGRGNESAGDADDEAHDEGGINVFTIIVTDAS